MVPYHLAKSQTVPYSPMEQFEGSRSRNKFGFFSYCYCFQLKMNIKWLEKNAVDVSMFKM